MKHATPHGVVYQGHTLSTVFTGLRRPSANPKTGPMVQAWVLNHGPTPPHERVKLSLDTDTCGDCHQRHSLGGGCYVQPFQGPRAVWEALRAGRYSVVGSDITAEQALKVLRGRSIRFGAYGNPSAASAFTPWEAIADGARTHTGYDHDWANPEHQSLRSILMASVETFQQKIQANKLGWRTFRTIADVDQVQPDEIICPATPEGGEKTNCDRCGLCSGASSTSRKNIAAVAHGTRKARARKLTFNL